MKKEIYAIITMICSLSAYSDEAKLSASVTYDSTCSIEFDKSDVEFGESVWMTLRNSTLGKIKIVEVKKEQESPKGSRFDESNWGIYNYRKTLHSGNTFYSGNYEVSIRTNLTPENSVSGTYTATATVAIECLKE